MQPLENKQKISREKGSHKSNDDENNNSQRLFNPVYHFVCAGVC